MLLSADIGGTKTQLALFPLEGGLRPKKFVVWPTSNFRSLKALLISYLKEIRTFPLYASIAVAGTISKNNIKMVNLGWSFSISTLKKRLPFKKIFFLNDLEAMAMALPKIKGKNLFSLNKVRSDSQGNIGVIAAGTGLGEAFLIRKHTSFPVPVATEGGHTEFAPQEEIEWELYNWLKEKFKHVSLERVISGPGIEHIYQFLSQRETKKIAYLSADKISYLALKERDFLAQKALDIFITAYGREAGNLALRGLTTGGVFLGGGIAPKILPFLKEGSFMQAFQDKGRLSHLVKKIPVKVIQHPYPVLLGAAIFGRQVLA